MTIVLDKTLDDRYRWEIIGLVVAGLVPILGVAFWEWDAYALMFLLSWEVIITSAVLGWLFNYPERSAVAGLAFALVLAPTGLLMWVVLDKAYDNARLLSMIRELASQTWIAMVLIAVYAGQACRSAMREAHVHGATIERNNRILISWILSVYLPFLVFVFILVGVNTVGVLTLAGVLIVKTAVDIGTLWRKRSRQISR
jgi:hypothetical protein